MNGTNEYSLIKWSKVPKSTEKYQEIIEKEEK